MSLPAELLEVRQILDDVDVRTFGVLELDVVTTPAVVVPMPRLERGLRSAGGTATFEVVLELVAVAAPDELLPFLERVVGGLVDGGVLVTAATPTTYGGGETLNPLPAYRVDVTWTHRTEVHA